MPSTPKTPKSMTSPKSLKYANADVAKRTISKRWGSAHSPSRVELVAWLKKMGKDVKDIDPTKTTKKTMAKMCAELCIEKGTDFEFAGDFGSRTVGKKYDITIEV